MGTLGKGQLVGAPAWLATGLSHAPTPSGGSHAQTVMPARTPTICMSTGSTQIGSALRSASTASPARAPSASSLTTSRSCAPSPPASRRRSCAGAPARRSAMRRSVSRPLASVSCSMMRRPGAPCRSCFQTRARMARSARLAAQPQWGRCWQVAPSWRTGNRRCLASLCCSPSRCFSRLPCCSPCRAHRCWAPRPGWGAPSSWGVPLAVGLLWQGAAPSLTGRLHLGRAWPCRQLLAVSASKLVAFLSR